VAESVCPRIAGRGWASGEPRDVKRRMAEAALFVREGSSRVGTYEAADEDGGMYLGETFGEFEERGYESEAGEG
jgi:hypothetical protein